MLLPVVILGINGADDSDREKLVGELEAQGYELIERRIWSFGEATVDCR